MGYWDSPCEIGLGGRLEHGPKNQGSMEHPEHPVEESIRSGRGNLGTVNIDSSVPVLAC